MDKTLLNPEDYSHLTPLIDCDPLVYRCGFAADSQVKKDGGDPESDYAGFALGNLKHALADMVGMFRGEGRRIFLTGSGNYREQVATILPYKGNRDNLHKPKYYRELKDYAIAVWDAEVIHGREADDALGCAQWERKDKSTVICSVDKDLKMIPGYNWNPVKHELTYIRKAEADMFLFWQMMVGDTSDNVPGIRGLGPKSADKIIAGCNNDLDTVREKVKELYRKEYGPKWQESFTEIGTLFWMQRVERHPCPFLW